MDTCSSTDIPSTTGTGAQGRAQGSSLQEVCHPNIDPQLDSLRLTGLQILLVGQAGLIALRVFGFFMSYTNISKALCKKFKSLIVIS